jgi:hypothetical protein
MIDFLTPAYAAVAIFFACSAAGVPMLVGGPMFNIDAAGEFWRNIPGLTVLLRPSGRSTEFRRLISRTFHGTDIACGSRR